MWDVLTLGLLGRGAVWGVEGLHHHKNWRRFAGGHFRHMWFAPVVDSQRGGEFRGGRGLLVGESGMP